MSEETRRVQLTLPECKQLAELLFDEVREDLGIPATTEDGTTIEISRGEWVDAVPKLQRAIKMTAQPARRRSSRPLKEKTERESLQPEA